MPVQDAYQRDRRHPSHQEVVDHVGQVEGRVVGVGLPPGTEYVGDVLRPHQTQYAGEQRRNHQQQGCRERRVLAGRAKEAGARIGVRRIDHREGATRVRAATSVYRAGALPACAIVHSVPAAHTSRFSRQQPSRAARLVLFFGRYVGLHGGETRNHKHCHQGRGDQ